MSELVTPIAAPEVDGVPVRFFRAPEAGPHLPWHALDDLYRAMRFDRALRREMLRAAQAFPGGEFRTVATPDGPVVIGSHPMAQGLIDAAVEAHGLSADFERHYVRAGSKAMKVMAGDLSPLASLQLVVAAARNTLGLRP